jgi:hypothetical protein
MLKRPSVHRPVVRIPPDAIIIPPDILPALMAAEAISASIWQSPPGRGRAGMIAGVHSSGTASATLLN